MWLIVDSTHGWFLEYWTFPEKRCVVSLKTDCEAELETLEAMCEVLKAMKVVPR